MIPRRPRTLALVAGGVVVLGGAGAAANGFGGGGKAPQARSTQPPASAQIEKTTLTETEDVDGSLGYGDQYTFSGTGRGTVTWLPGEGSTVSLGEPVYKLNTDPIPLLYGSLPIYRTLKSGIEGSDVLQFERNLRDLGYTGFTVDKTFSSATADAVKRWQEDLGVTETGTIEAGKVAVARGRIRVAELKKSVGDQAGGPLLTYTRTTRIVSVDLSVDLQRLAKKGASVTVEMPGGETVQGKITKVGTVATKPASEEEDATIKVTIAVRGDKELGNFDQAPVKVGLTADRRKNVLAVPVGALMALPDGGYGVQVVDGGNVRTVAVETGMFADGKVEVTASELREGMKVGIPK